VDGPHRPGAPAPGTGLVEVALGMRGSRTLRKLVSVTVPELSAASVVVADFNGDRRADLAALTPDGALHEWLGTGSGGFVHVLARPELPGSLMKGDFNGDGAVDLVIGGNAVIRVLFGGNNGGFHPGIDTPGFGTLASVGDLDGDRRSDVIVGDGAQ